VSGKSRTRPGIWSLLLTLLACALLAAQNAGAATHSFAPVRGEHGSLVFKLRGIAPDEIVAAYLKTHGHKRKLPLKRVRSAARRGALRLRVAGRTAHRSRSARGHGPKLIIVTSTAVRSTSSASTFTPTADAYTSSDKPSRNYGFASDVRVDGSPIRNSYLRFDVRGLTTSVTRATLRVYARSSSTTGISLHGVADSSWGESTITYANAPSIGAKTADSGSFRSAAYVSLDATSLFRGDGTVSLALKSTGSNSKSLDSREGTNKPQLVVETDSTASAPPPPPSPGPAPAPGSDPQPAFPVRASFYYPWFPETWMRNGSVFTRYHPTLGFYDSSSTAVIQHHVRAMQYGGVEAGISSWWGPGHNTDKRFGTILAATNAMASTFRWTLYYENESLGDPGVATLASDLAYIRDHYATNPAYFRVNGRFVVFVYADGGDACGMVDRWRQANAGINAYVVLKVFSGYRFCSSQPDGWHQYSPAVAADSQGGYSYSISPGFYKADESAPRLGRDITRWNQNVRDMVASNAPFQLVVSFNEWGEGTATESADEWASSSGYGDYLDALHLDGQSSSSPPPPSPPPSPPPNQAPAASFSAAPNPALVGQTVSFNGSASSDPDGSVANYRWDLDGDGSFETDSGSSASTSRAYSSAGDVTVRLQVTDNAGASADASRALTVNAPDPAPPPPPPSTDPVIAAAGDIACDPGSSSYNNGLGSATECRQRPTSDLVTGAGLAAVLTLGDNQYDDGALSKFQASFDPTWGRVKGIIHPAVGNHEYQSSGATGYFDYYNGSGNLTGAAGERGKAYYSFDIGAWHLIALNSNCSFVSCAVGSAQEQWLRADLAAHPNACVLAYWHHPRFSSGTHGNNVSADPLWQALYDANADLVLNGHDHGYERFAPQTPAGAPDPARGMRQFVVGTGGRNHYSFPSPQPNSQVRNADTFGVLRVTLHANGYDWHFVPEAGRTFADTGTGNCH
jgi:hypothetical protein